ESDAGRMTRRYRPVPVGESEAIGSHTVKTPSPCAGAGGTTSDRLTSTGSSATCPPRSRARPAATVTVVPPAPGRTRSPDTTPAPIARPRRSRPSWFASCSPRTSSAVRTRPFQNATCGTPWSTKAVSRAMVSMTACLLQLGPAEDERRDAFAVVALTHEPDAEFPGPVQDRVPAGQLEAAEVEGESQR